MLGACAADGPGSPEPESQTAAAGSATTTAGASAEFVAVDFDFAEAPAELASGPAQFELDNDGRVVHNVVIEELDDVLVVTAQPGQTAVGTVDLTPGTYTYYCSIAGHRNLGMEGTVIVG